MRTLSNNIRIPEDNDPGNVWSDAIEDNFEKLNDTITNLDNISIQDVNRDSTIIDNASWVVDADGKGYNQVVSMPVGLDLTKVDMRFRITSGPKLNRFINPTVIPLSISSFELIVNDASLDLEILYT